MKVAILTITCANYFAKAAAMASSAKKAMPGLKCYVCLLERSHISELSTEPFDEVILAKDLGILNFDHFIFSHTPYEGCASLKATFFKHVASFGRFEFLIHLDSDVLVFSPFSEVFELLQAQHVLITPHFIRDDPLLLNEQIVSVLKCGIFNTGFIAIKVSHESLSFLDWWEHRLLSFCYIDFERGLYVDQRWIDYALSFFNLYIIRHEGYNAANWNEEERPISIRDGEYYAGNSSLRFYHFSGVSSGDDLKRLRQVPVRDGRESEAISLRARYFLILGERNHEQWSLREWSYARYRSGELIMGSARLACRFMKQLRPKDYGKYLATDPFSFPNEDLGIR